MALDPKILDGHSWRSDAKEGLYAELDASGQVRKLGFYRDGRAVELDANPRRPSYVDHTELRWSPESEEDRAAWTEARAHQLLALAGRDRASFMKCSFCGKGQQEVRKLIAGPTVFICDECVSLCSDILAEEF